MNYLSALPDFVDNKYSRWYELLILKAKSRTKPEVYCERHHIVPRSLGGTNHSNLVWLTAREHFIAHAFLSKCFVGQAKVKMDLAFYALLKFKNKHLHRYEPRCSRTVAIARERRAKAISAALKGRPNTWTKSTSEAQKESLRKVNKERVWTDEMRTHHAEKAKARTGEKRSEQAKKNLSEGAKKRFAVPHITINNGVRNTLIPESKLNEYPGWVRGKVFKKRPKK